MIEHFLILDFVRDAVLGILILVLVFFAIALFIRALSLSNSDDPDDKTLR